jgi:hypothetical protein
MGARNPPVAFLNWEAQLVRITYKFNERVAERI